MCVGQYRREQTGASPGASAGLVHLAVRKRVFWRDDLRIELMVVAVLVPSARRSLHVSPLLHCGSGRSAAGVPRLPYRRVGLDSRDGPQLSAVERAGTAATRDR